MTKMDFPPQISSSHRPPSLPLS